MRRVNAPMFRRLRRLSTVSRQRNRKLPTTGPTFAEFLSRAAGTQHYEIDAARQNGSTSKPEPISVPVLDGNFLSDSFGRFHNYLRISLTERCNLRCTYCMPAEGVPLSPSSHLLKTEEIERLVSIFARMGTTKIRLTGGEPTLRPDVVEICEKISRQPGIRSIGMTSNGVNLLRRVQRIGVQARLIEHLHCAGLRSINISLDTMCPATFAKLTRRPAATHARVLDAIGESAQLPHMSVKVNCVVVRGSNDSRLGEFVDYFASRPQLGNVSVRFIEWMPFSANDWNAGKLVPASEIIARVMNDGISLNPEPAEDPNDTTRWYSVDGAKMKLGVISSMTNHFCGGCNRVRITSDGALKTCLFGEDSVSLRDLLRTGKDDLDVAKAIHFSLSQKHFAHGGRKDGALGLAKHVDSNRPMILIGG